ncbi:hypothetical protein M758_4G136600 [Ceratodon purpureus]|nr:hypothetical protein M758_4G136600 [Ceratodon purpureus]
MQCFGLCSGFTLVGTCKISQNWEVLVGFKRVMASVEETRVAEDGDEVQQKGPLIVRFPRQTAAVEPVKLESEEAEAESKPPRNMIQVYLLAGYLVGRWAWARFQERQSRRKFDGRRDPKD